MLDLLIETEEGSVSRGVQEYEATAGPEREMPVDSVRADVEECFGVVVTQGFIYRIPTGRITPVAISETLREKRAARCGISDGCYRMSGCPHRRHSAGNASNVNFGDSAPMCCKVVAHAVCRKQGTRQL